MAKPISQYFSLDDLWSVVGYALMVSVNRLTHPPMQFAQISMLASGMIAIVWLASPALRTRNKDRGPNLRIAFWVVVAVVSAIMASQ